MSSNARSNGGQVVDVLGEPDMGEISEGADGEHGDRIGGHEARPLKKTRAETAGPGDPLTR